MLEDLITPLLAAHEYPKHFQKHSVFGDHLFHLQLEDMVYCGNKGPLNNYSNYSH